MQQPRDPSRFGPGRVVAGRHGDVLSIHHQRSAQLPVGHLAGLAGGRRPGSGLGQHLSLCESKRRRVVSVLVGGRVWVRARVGVSVTIKSKVRFRVNTRVRVRVRVRLRVPGRGQGPAAAPPSY